MKRSPAQLRSLAAVDVRHSSVDRVSEISSQSAQLYILIQCDCMDSETASEQVGSTFSFSPSSAVWLAAPGGLD